MLDATWRPTVLSRIRIAADTEPGPLARAVRSDLEQGAVGVTLEPAVAGELGGEAIPDALVSAVAGLTAVIVAAEGRQQAERALGAGASGIMVASPVDPGLRSFVAGGGNRLWVTGVVDPPEVGPDGECLILETSVGSVRRLALLCGSVPAPISVARVACSLPAAAQVDDGAIEALVTLAVMGGATVLRCDGSFGHGTHGDVRVVRRCADVATELLHAGAAMGEATPGDQWVAS